MARIHEHRVNLAAPLALVNAIPLAMQGDDEADELILHVEKGREPEDMTGYTVRGYLQRADGVRVALSGEVDKDVVSVTLQEACYRVPGTYKAFVRLEKEGGPKLTVFFFAGRIEGEGDGRIVDEENTIPGIAELLQMLEDVERAARAKNMLDNSSFKTPINQRGKTEYAGAGYTIDRWAIPYNADAKASVAAGYMALKNDSSGTNMQFEQYMERGTLEAGKAYTMALMTKDGEILCKAATVEDNDALYLPLGNGAGYFHLYKDAGKGKDIAGVVMTPGKTLDVVWIALYEGAFTADNLPAYVQKEHAVEMMACQRYYHIYATAAARPANGMDAAPPMRLYTPTQGTVAIDGVTRYYNSADL